MCTTCDQLRLDRCPPALSTRERDFDEDLAREREHQSRLGRTPTELPGCWDATTELVLRTRLIDPPARRVAN